MLWDPWLFERPIIAELAKIRIEPEQSEGPSHRVKLRNRAVYEASQPCKATPLRCEVKVGRGKNTKWLLFNSNQLQNLPSETLINH